MGVPTSWVIGGYQSDFARSSAREGTGFSELFAETVQHTIEAAGVAVSDIDVVPVGNALRQLLDTLDDECRRRYGLDDRYVRAIAELNVANAKANPNAQTRDWNFGPTSFSDDDAANPVIEGRVRRTDCSAMTDGGAGIVVI